MAKKPLKKDKDGIQKVMRFGDYLGDSLGQFSLNAISGLVGQLTYFYTDKVGVAAGAVATAFLIVKILDAFTDLIMGYIVDHTKPGKERYRPWLLRMALPAVIMMVLLFTVPTGISPTLQILYMFITNLMLTAIIYTAVAIPYASLQVVRTASQQERGNIGTWRAGAGYVAGMIIAITIIPITNLLGGDQMAWIKFGTVLAVLSGLCLLICYKSNKETNPVLEQEKADSEEEEAVPFMEALRSLIHNKYWVMIIVFSLASNVLYGLSNSAGSYYAKWIYGNDNLVAISGAVGLIPTVLGFALVGPMIKFLGVTKTLRISFAIGLISNILRILNPYNFVYNTVLGVFSAFSNIPMMCLLGVCLAMVIDYNEYKYGNKMLASSQSAFSFGGKVGSGVGSSIIGWCLAIAAYDPTAEVATFATKQAIFTFNIYMPILLFGLMFVLSWKFDLEKRLPAIHEEIARRKTEKQNGIQ